MVNHLIWRNGIDTALSTGCQKGLTHVRSSTVMHSSVLAMDNNVTMRPTLLGSYFS